jgi:hypothetical protein
MPLCVNVGLNRKASRDYQSSGASINITAELDATLLTKPQELQSAIDGLYEQARVTLNRQSAFRASAGSDAPPEAPVAGDGNGHSVAGARPMTPRQRSAILAIARRAEQDPAISARGVFGVSLDELTSRQASQLIDSLKG